MDSSECYAVYLDDRVREERWIEKDAITSQLPTLDEPSDLCHNVQLFLDILKKVYLCNTRKSFISQLAELCELSRTTCNPIFALVAIDGSSSSEQISQASEAPSMSQPECEKFCSLQFLASFPSDLQSQDGPHTVLPVAILRSPKHDDSGEPNVAEAASESTLEPIEKTVSRCLDAGALEVLTTPLDASRIKGLSIHAYRAHKTAQKERSRVLSARKLRKQSWVGASDQQPYAYLREAMVSKLMRRICNPEEEVEDSQMRELYILHDRRRHVESEIGKWDFSAHDFSEDELIHAACVMLEHALQLPELEPWRISTEELHAFLLATRSAYNSFVLYHNFRHAIDVLQSTFHFLVSIAALPPYPHGTEIPTTKSPIASLLTPFNALTLLITAIGHDVGHPGVNNIFLVKLNAPLAQLYNDNSVLEAFHCAAFSQILRCHWHVVFTDTKLRKLMISSILATDMGVHHKFMESLGQLQEKYHQTNSVEGWKDQEVDTYRALLCGLLIKCADISNVARPWTIAERWTNILQQEFAHQGEMENDIGMETALFGGPPELGNLTKLANGQISFMKIFALPLFDGISDIIPELTFTSAEIRRNKSIWRELINRASQGKTTHEVSAEASIPPPSQLPLKVPESPPPMSTANHERTPPATWTCPPALSQIQLDKEMHRGIDESLENEHDCPASSIPPSISPLTISTGQDAGAEDNQESASSLCNGGTRRSQGHRQFQRSSGRASTITAVNRQSESTSGTRTQSTSTYTNNTVMTPISSTTQASSFISVESSNDENDASRRTFDRNPGSRLPSSCSGSVADNDAGGSSRATPVAMPADSDRHTPSRPNGADDKSPHFMAALIDKSFGNGQSNGFSITSPTSSNSASNYHPTSSSHSSNPDSQYPPHNGGNGNTNRTVPRRRSRLRLAFWRRNRQSPPTNATDDL
ncbi:3',5'-cyclic-nucleotide phosphodiesterase [Onygenales sp. PD_40]|nr:3',5'-cyclic-nucleotide phosphodiesterase [Onygenales sp. PD_40]KAK2791334.1 3',5'-cyclic-nucleotide phosphodiesterase [Emmonsiellopsis sp. PD_33]KAK2799117.1 3',5'-cyclic-nucleotide phosphodiesterase [Onygenales sp. PD_10]